MSRVRGILFTFLVLSSLLFMGAVAVKKITVSISRTGTAEIVTDPPGQEIYLDGSPIGKTPLTVVMSAGTHSVNVGQMVENIDVKPNSHERYVFDLWPGGRQVLPQIEPKPKESK